MPSKELTNVLTPTVPITRAIPAVEENIPDEKIVCATVQVAANSPSCRWSVNPPDRKPW